MKQNILDYLGSLIIKVTSKKFFAWVVASIALFSHYITENTWLMVTMLWLGVQGAIDWMTRTPE